MRIAKRVLSSDMRRLSYGNTPGSTHRYFQNEKRPGTCRAEVAHVPATNARWWPNGATIAQDRQRPQTAKRWPRTSIRGQVGHDAHPEGRHSKDGHLQRQPASWQAFGQDKILSRIPEPRSAPRFFGDGRRPANRHDVFTAGRDRGWTRRKRAASDFSPPTPSNQKGGQGRSLGNPAACFIVRDANGHVLA
jgi:hypothetical protein